MDLNNYIEHIETSVKYSNLEVSKLTHDVLSIDGLTSNKVKMFLNNLCSLDSSIYLELGVYKGGTFCNALYHNDCKGIGIDNWSSNLTPNTSIVINNTNENIQEVFLENIKKYTILDNINVYQGRFQTFNFDIIEKPNIIFYDGEINQIEIYSTLANLFKNITGTFIMVFDDWNWTNKLVKAFLKDSKVKELYSKEIFTEIEDPEDYWNGLGIFILNNNNL